MKTFWQFVLAAIIILLVMGIYTGTLDPGDLFGAQTDAPDDPSDTTVVSPGDSAHTCYTINSSPDVANMAYDFNFISNGVEYWYFEMDADASTIAYGAKHGESTVVAYSNGTWISEEYRKIYVNAKLALSEDLTKWLEVNAVSKYYERCNHVGTSTVETIQAATCTQNGTARETCFICGITQIIPIYATGHRYIDGTCENCGSAQRSLFGGYSLRPELTFTDECFSEPLYFYSFNGQYFDGITVDAREGTITYGSRHSDNYVIAYSNGTWIDNTAYVINVSEETLVSEALYSFIETNTVVHCVDHNWNLLDSFWVSCEEGYREIFNCSWCLSYKYEYSDAGHAWDEAHTHCERCGADYDGSQVTPEATVITSGAWKMNDTPSNFSDDYTAEIRVEFPSGTVRLDPTSMPTAVLSVQNTSVDFPVVKAFYSATDSTGVTLCEPESLGDNTILSFFEDIEVSSEFYSWFITNFTKV